MSREKDFVKNTLILSIGKFLPKLTSFITLPILTSHLSKAELGTYDLIQTLLSLLFPLASLQITTAAFRYLIDCRNDDKKKKEIVTSTFLVCVPLSLIVCALLFFFYGSQPVMIRILIAAYFFQEVMYQASGQIVRGIGNNKVYSIGSSAVSIISAVCIVILVYGKEAGITGALLALFLSNLVGTVYYMARCRILSMIDPTKCSREMIKVLLKYSLPVIPNNLSMWVLSVSDRLVISSFMGVEANAVYSVANKIPVILGIAHGVLVMAWQENASLALQDQDAESYYSRMHDYVFKLNIGFTALIIGVTPWLYSLLIRGDYSESYIHVPVLVLGSLFNVMSAFAGGIYAAHKKMKNVGLSSVVAAVINLVLDLCFVKMIGIWAGTISTVLAYFVLYIYRLIDSKRFQKMTVDWKKGCLMMMEIILMIVFCMLNHRALNLVNLMLGILIMSCYNRDLLKSGMTVLKERIGRAR